MSGKMCAKKFKNRGGEQRKMQWENRKSSRAGEIRLTRISPPPGAGRVVLRGLPSTVDETKRQCSLPLLILIGARGRGDKDGCGVAFAGRPDVFGKESQMDAPVSWVPDRNPVEGVATQEVALISMAMNSPLP